jgi:hypothetical protein
MQHTKTFLYFFVKKTQTSQLIAIKDNKSCTYILEICKKTEQSKKSRMAPRSQTVYLAQPYGLDFISRLNPVTGSNQ